MNRWIVVVSLLVVGAGCQDDPDDDGGDETVDAAVGCPMTQPAEATGCGTEPVLCEYLIEACACGPSDVMWHCSCANGAWSCSRDYDCYRCP